MGEVLFDSFEDGTRVLGGAPFNVAWHLQAFGLEPLLLTRIGDDEDGRQITRTMGDWGMDRRGVQVDRNVPTGLVRVLDTNSEPSYNIIPDRAYDRLDAGAALEALAETPGLLLYHGTLATRSEPSKSTIRELRRRAALPVFLDVNLRDPWWSPSEVSSLMKGATWIKLNQAELQLLAPPAKTVGDSRGVEVEPSEGRLRQATDATQVIVTLGERGARVACTTGSAGAQPASHGSIIDTVGAGDAFSSLWIVGLARGWSIDSTLRRALDFAARICSIRGATTTDATLYRKTVASWNQAGV